jgi:hypothetical protein
MDQPRNFLEQSDRYGGIPLGVEAAWPALSGAPTAVPGLSSSPSSSPSRDSGVGAAVSFAAALLLGAALLAGLAPHARADQEASGSAPGTVETVREVALHAAELVVRLDDGRTVRLVLDRTEYFQPGERVRVVGGRVLRS